MRHLVPTPIRRANTTAPAPGAPSEALLVPASSLPHRPPRELVALARHGLGEAAVTRSAGPRYATAHLAALRAAAAVLAARARPAPPAPPGTPGARRRSRPASVWSLLTQVAPELGEWAAYFATAAVKRAAAEAGLPRVVTAREADDLLRDAERFCALVEITLGLPGPPPIAANHPAHTGQARAG